MESNTYTSMEKALSLFMWMMKKMKAVIITYTVLLFATFPLIQLLVMILEFSKENGKYVKMMKYYATDFSTTTIGSIAMAFSVIMAMSVFCYLHNKRRADLFGSFPVSRRMLFFVSYIAALLACVVPLVIVGFIGAALTLSIEGFVSVLIVICSFVIGILLSISALAFLSLCCGTVVDTLCSYAVISVIYPILVELAYQLPQNIIPGMVDRNVWSTIFTILTPIAVPYNLVYGNGIIFGVVMAIIVSAALMLASYSLCKIRKAELAQTAFAFNMLENVIKVAAITTVGFGIGWACSSLGYNYLTEYIWFTFGMVVAIFAANLVLHLVYHRGFSGLKSSLNVCVISFVGIWIFVFIVATGLFGYDTKVPDAKDVAGVEINMAYYDEEQFVIDGKDYLEKILTDKEQINDVIKIHKSSIKEMCSRKIKFMYSLTGFQKDDDWDDSDETEMFDRNASYEVTYHLKNNKTIKRYYTTSKGVSQKLTDKLFKYMSRDYEAFTKIPTKYSSSVYIYQLSDYKNYKDWHNSDEDRYAYLLREKKKEEYETKVNLLKTAMLKDIQNDKAYIYLCSSGVFDKKMKWEDYLYKIDFYYTTDERELDSDYAEDIEDPVKREEYYDYLENTDEEETYSANASLLIPKSYVNTIKAMKELGLEPRIQDEDE